MRAVRVMEHHGHRWVNLDDLENAIAEYVDEFLGLERAIAYDQLIKELRA